MKMIHLKPEAYSYLQDLSRQTTVVSPDRLESDDTVETAYHLGSEHGFDAGAADLARWLLDSDRVQVVGEQKPKMIHLKPEAYSYLQKLSRQTTVVSPDRLQSDDTVETAYYLGSEHGFDAGAADLARWLLDSDRVQVVSEQKSADNVSAVQSRVAPQKQLDRHFAEGDTVRFTPEAIQFLRDSGVLFNPAPTAKNIGRVLRAVMNTDAVAHEPEWYYDIEMLMPTGTENHYVHRVFKNTAEKNLQSVHADVKLLA